MQVYHLRLMGRHIRFGDDGPYKGEPCWKTDVDNTGWSVGQADLSAELQEAVDDVMRGAKLLPPLQRKGK